MNYLLLIELILRYKILTKFLAPSVLNHVRYVHP